MGSIYNIQNHVNAPDGDGPPGLNILIVGGGIAGLTAAIACREKGFNVTVLESQAKFTHVGAGLLISSNASRVLCDMGMEESLEKVSIRLSRVIFMKHNDSTVLFEKSYEGLEEQYGAPLWQIHRADLHDILLAKAEQVNVRILMGIKIQKYVPEIPGVLLENGEMMNADVIVAADGYRSRARAELLGRNVEPRASGTSAFRAVIAREAIQDDPILMNMMDIEKSTTYTWIGEGRHVLCYPIRRGQVMNVVMNQPIVHTTGSQFVAPADPAEILELYADWDAPVRSIVSRMSRANVLEWKLCDLEPMDSWIFSGGRTVLMGDACHPMLPSAAQGAGMAIEDGACLAELLARAQSRDQIPAVLQAYQDLRLPRCTEVVDNGQQNAKKWHAKDNVKGGTVTDEIWDYDIKREARRVVLESAWGLA